jgi:RNA polymerase sigma-70 factor, ECF subfamily
MKASPSLAAPRDEPVCTALADAQVLRRLLSTALATLRWRSSLPALQRAAEAEDIVQEAAQRALARQTAYDPTKDALRWLVGFVVMVCRERTKRRSLHNPVAPGGHESISLEQLARDLARPVAETVADHLDARAMLDRLPAAEHELLRLHFADGLTAAEIGQQLGISDGAVRVRLHRALTRLKDEYAGGKEAQP